MKLQAYFPFLLVALLAVSCTERIDVDLNDEGFERLVVDGWITNQPAAHTVKLTLTTSYFANEEPKAATGANVTISDGTSIITLAENAPGIYQTEPTFAGKIGSTYTLDIHYNEEDYTSTQYLDTVPEIDTLIAAPAIDDFSGEIIEDLYALYLFTQELPGLGDHYMWRVTRNDTLLTDTLREVTFVEDAGVDGNYIGGWEVDYLEGKPGDRVKLEQLSIQPEVYDAFFAVLLETDWRGGIFDSPPANVPTNIDNGALGFFVAAGVTDYEITIPN